MYKPNFVRYFKNYRKFHIAISISLHKTNVCGQIFIDTRIIYLSMQMAH
jgi:hypothetical protein